MKKKVFVSLPMHGRTEEEILQAQKDAIKDIQSVPFPIGDGEEYELIDTVHDDPGIDSTGKQRLWYLGRALQRMAEADVLYFDDGWQNAKGCWVEFVAALLYDKEFEYCYESNLERIDAEKIIDIFERIANKIDYRGERDEPSTTN